MFIHTLACTYMYIHAYTCVYVCYTLPREHRAIRLTKRVYVYISSCMCTRHLKRVYVYIRLCMCITYPPVKNRDI